MTLLLIIIAALLAIVDRVVAKGFDIVPDTIIGWSLVIVSELPKGVLLGPIVNGVPAPLLLMLIKPVVPLTSRLDVVVLKRT